MTRNEKAKKTQKTNLQQQTKPTPPEKNKPKKPSEELPQHLTVCNFRMIMLASDC